MKRILFLLIILSFQPAIGKDGFFTFGFSWGAFTRSGFYLGYNFDKSKAVELHFGGIPHMSTTGVSAKLKPIKNNDQFYLIYGLSKVAYFSRIESSDDGSKEYSISVTHGFNFGIGNETLFKKSSWRFLYEGGFFLAVSEHEIKRTISANGDVSTFKESVSEKSNNGFFGLGLIKY